MPAERTDAVVALIRRADRFLFVKRSDYLLTASGYWTPVSGRLEKGETQEAALRREVKEEVGLEVEPVMKVAELPSPDGLYLLHYWTVEISSGTASITDNEATDLKWVTLEEMKNLTPSFDDDIRVIEALSRDLG